MPPPLKWLIAYKEFSFTRTKKSGPIEPLTKRLGGGTDSSGKAMQVVEVKANAPTHEEKSQMLEEG